MKLSFSDGWAFGLGALTALYFMLMMSNVFTDWLDLNPTDDSDKSAEIRSGMKVHTDYKTGLQYLSDGRGGLMPRISEDGYHMRLEVEE